MLFAQYVIKSIMEDQQYYSRYQQLLRDLKSTVEGLLVSQVANVWTIYGGLNRLHSSVEKIFRHGSVTGSETVSIAPLAISIL